MSDIKETPLHSAWLDWEVILAGKYSPEEWQCFQQQAQTTFYAGAIIAMAAIERGTSFEAIRAEIEQGFNDAMTKPGEPYRKLVRVKP